MSNPIDLVISALSYYDNNKEKFAKFFEKIKYYRVEISPTELELDVIYFYDKNKKVLLESRFEILGSYNNHAKTWLWAWSNPIYSKNRTSISRLILNHGFNIQPEPQNQFLKTELITSRFRIYNQIQLDMHIAIGSYISKSPLICNLQDYLDTADIDDTDTNEVLYKIIFDPSNDKYILYSLILLDYNKLVL